MKIFQYVVLLILLIYSTSCVQADNKKKFNNMDLKTNQFDTATFGAGCFWCVEAVFQNLKGVQKVISGYSGGNIKNPSYKEVCMGITGHAEVCQIIFDQKQIKFDELLEVFWQTHDPTTLNKQGNDIGTQYRSVIFYHSEQQKIISEQYKNKLNLNNV